MKFNSKHLKNILSTTMDIALKTADYIIYKVTGNKNI